MGGRAWILFGLAVALLLAPAVASAQSWAIQTVDLGSARAGPTSLGLDPTGSQDYPVISYLGAPRNLKYAALDRLTKVWGLTRVDAGGEFSSLDVDAAGIVHVAYLDGNTQELKYWRQNQGQSSIQLVDTDAAQFNSIRVDGGGTPHISFWRANSAGVSTPDRLRVADYNGTAWVPTFADPTPPRGRYNSLVLDNAGNLGIAYYDADASGPYSKKLRVALRIAGIWSYDVADSAGDPGRFNSVQIGAGALLRISYIASTTATLRFASDNGALWTLQDVASVGAVAGSSVTSLALESGGNPLIAFYNATTNRLMYASRTGASAWSAVIVDSVGNGGGYCSLRLDRAGRPIITYYDPSTQSVRIAYGNYPDGDGDGIPDAFDAYPTDPDHNQNGILDGKEGGGVQGASGTTRLKDEPIFGCGSLAALYGAGPRGGGPPPADLLILLGPVAFLLLRRKFRRAL